MTRHRKAFALVAVLIAPLTSGCLVVSLHPIYDKKTLVFDERLVGVWANDEDKTALTIARGEWTAYEISYRDATTHEELTGHLTQVGDERYMDVTPRKGRDFGSYLIPVHGVFRVRGTGDGLDLQVLNFDWFMTSWNAGTGLATLRPSRDGRDNILLTAGTPELRAWLEGHQKRDEPFGPVATFRKQP